MRRLTINLLLLVIVLAAEHASALDCVKLAPSETHVEDAGYSRGLLWRIESVEGRVNHLFGTIHISDPRVTDLSPIVTEVLMSSDSFGMEVLLDVEAMLQMSKAMYYGAGQSLDQNLEPGLFERTVELLGEYGVSLEAARNLKPWAAYTTLSLPPGKTAMPLDLLLLRVARQGGKEVFGLESIGEQVAVFDGLAISDQTELLEQAVCHYG
ncbi:MAG: TraB/GumN family protein, partial [Gammaproteobacteria bacterium]|nr:TraB/GumN family protein [Gammaproteobacteria bacterium]